MKRKKITPSKYKGDDYFQGILDNIGCNMPVYEIRSYLLGCVLSIDIVPFSHIFDEILSLDSPDEVKFESDAQLKQFNTQLMALWNELAKYQGEKDVPPFRKLSSDLRDASVLIEALKCRESELENFLTALAEGNTVAETCPNEATASIIRWMEERSDVLGKLIDNIQRKSDDDLCSSGIKILEDLETKWQAMFPVLEREFRQARISRIKMMKTTFQKSQTKFHKVGRNEPCPCGSGKKYKKCCGIVH